MKAQPDPGCFTPRGNSVPTAQKAEWATASVCTHAENLVPTAGFNPQTVKPVASHYTCVTKAYRGRWDITPQNLRIRWTSVVTLHPGRHNPWREPSYS